MALRNTNKPNLLLGRRDDRVMTWSSSLNIYRVNRLNLIDLTENGGKEGRVGRPAPVPVR